MTLLHATSMSPNEKLCIVANWAVELTFPTPFSMKSLSDSLIQLVYSIQRQFHPKRLLVGSTAQHWLSEQNVLYISYNIGSADIISSLNAKHNLWLKKWKKRKHKRSMHHMYCLLMKEQFNIIADISDIHARNIPMPSSLFHSDFILVPKLAGWRLLGCLKRGALACNAAFNVIYASRRPLWARNLEMQI